MGSSRTDPTPDSDRLQLREALNVPDLKKRDQLVREIARIRGNAVLEKNTIEYWNRQHPDQPPFDTTLEDQIIAWCDGKGPLPKMPND